MKNFLSFLSYMHNKEKQLGQALVTLLFFAVIGMTITSAAVVILLTNIRATTNVESGTDSYYLADSGVEAMLLQLLRNPLYQGTQSWSLNGGTITVTVTQGSPIGIVATGQSHNSISQIQVQTVYTNGKQVIQSWKEIL